MTPSTEKPAQEWVRIWFQHAHSGMRWAKEQGWRVVQWVIVLLAGLATAHSQLPDIPAGLFTVLSMAAVVAGVYYLLALHAFERISRRTSEGLVADVPGRDDLLPKRTFDRDHVVLLVVRLLLLAFALIFTLMVINRASARLPNGLSGTAPAFGCSMGVSLTDNKLPSHTIPSSPVPLPPGAKGPNLQEQLASQHLMAAAYFARSSAQIEAGKALTLAPATLQAYFSYGLGAVISAAAFIECSINELYTDAIDGSQTVFGHLSPRFPALLASLWPEVERMSALRKHELALIAANVAPYDRGAAPYQTASNLLRLRNALIHFKPEWDHELDEHGRLEAALRSCFLPSPFADPRRPFLPSHCLSAGCAAWATKTAKSFVEDFAVRAGLRLELHAYGTSLDP